MIPLLDLGQRKTVPPFTLSHLFSKIPLSKVHIHPPLISRSSYPLYTPNGEGNLPYSNLPHPIWLLHFKLVFRTDSHGVASWQRGEAFPTHEVDREQESPRPPSSSAPSQWRNASCVGLGVFDFLLGLIQLQLWIAIVVSMMSSTSSENSPKDAIVPRRHGCVWWFFIG